MLFCVVGTVLAADVTSETKPARELWRSSRLVGSPEPPSPYTVEQVFTNLTTKNPIYLAPEPGTDQLFLIDRSTNAASAWQIRRFRNDPAASSSEFLVAFTNRQVYALTFHPNYTRNGLLYVFHNGPTDQPERTNRITRYTVARNGAFRVEADSAFPIIEWRSAGHDGGDLAFGNDGMLYLTSGDGTSDSDGWDSGQDLSRLLSKLMRLDVDHAAPGLGYVVPSDNPFVGQPNVRPETWAYGFRNPWRMSIDARTGDIWVGQNGQDLWESAHLVRPKDNIGWSVYEGGHPFQPHRRRGPTPIVPPTIEHSHAEFRSLTGGTVYYGDELPELNGAYIYGDYSTGKIWGARQRNGKLEWHRELAETTLQIVCFRVDSHGRMLVVDHTGSIHRLRPRPPATTPADFPRRLSDTGLFASAQDHRPAPGLIAYDVNAPGWADGAIAERFIGLPGEAKIAYAESRGWNFTNGTALVQTLWLGAEKSAAQARQRIETRVLLRQEGQWAAYSYRWNEAQTDALLVEQGGANLTVSVTQPDGTSGRQAWHIPSRAECLTCHSRAVNYVLGLTEPQMNRPVRTAGVEENQRHVLLRLGVLTGAEKPAPESALHLTNPYDEQAPIAQRARSYLHANCSGCHVEAGGGNSKLEFEITRPEPQMNLVSTRPLHDSFGIPNAMLIAPGDPGRSILLHRISRRGPGQMPPLVTSQVDDRAVALFRRWISEMPVDSTPVHEWTMAELRPALMQLDANRSIAQGRAIFERVGCAQCHRFNGNGGAVGPDLTAVRTRLDRPTVLESIVEPSKLIADEYANYEFVKADGETVVGHIEHEDANEVILRTASAIDEPVRLRKSDIRQRAKSSLSNMPAGIVNILEKDQILDLLSYLLTNPEATPTGSPKP